MPTPGRTLPLTSLVTPVTRVDPVGVGAGVSVGVVIKYGSTPVQRNDYGRLRHLQRRILALDCVFMVAKHLLPGIGYNDDETAFD
jgi:hypothetical protein